MEMFQNQKYTSIEMSKMFKGDPFSEYMKTASQQYITEQQKTYNRSVSYNRHKVDTSGNLQQNIDRTGDDWPD